MTLSEHLRLDASGLDGDVRAGTLSGWYLQVANRMREAADALDARQAPADPVCTLCDGEPPRLLERCPGCGRAGRQPTPRTALECAQLDHPVGCRCAHPARQAPAEPPADLQETIAGLELERADAQFSLGQAVIWAENHPNNPAYAQHAETCRKRLATIEGALALLRALPTGSAVEDAAAYQWALLRCRQKVNARRQSAAITEDRANADGRDADAAKYAAIGEGLGDAFRIIDDELDALAPTGSEKETRG